MKLHLPKMLLTAVLAVCVAPAVWGETVTVNTDSNIGDVYQSGTTTKIEVTGGTLSFGETTGVYLSEGLYIAGGTVTAGQNGGTGFVSKATDVYIQSDGVLRLTEKDSLGYDDNATKSITLGGTEGHKAILELGARQTQTTNITMKGYAEIKYASTLADNYKDIVKDQWGNDQPNDDRPAICTWDGDFIVEGTNNTISANLDIRKALTIEIKEKASLSITGKIANGPNFNNGLTISGAGIVSFGDNSFVNDFNRTAATIKVHTQVSGAIRNKNSFIEFGDGTKTVTSSVSRLELCDRSGASASVAIKSGYTLKVTGDDSTDFSNGSLILGEWGSTSNGTLDVEGTLLSANGSAMMGDGGGRINVKGGGTVAIKGIKVKNNDTKLDLSVGGTGKLILGSDGIAASGATNAGKYSSSIAGTIGIMADSVSIDRDLTITGAAIFDTTKYAISDYTVAQNAETPAGGTLKLTGDLLLGTGTTGSVKLQGVGIMQLGAISSAVDINASSGTLDFLGTLSLAEGKKLTLGNGVSVTVSAGNLNAFAVVGQRIDEKGVISASGNGFIYGQHYLVAGGSLEGSATLSYDGQSYTIDNANRGFGEATIDCSIYSLTSGSAKVSEVSAYATAQGGTVSSYQLSAGTTLNVDTTTPATLAVNGNATLNITNGTTSTTTVNHSAVTIASGAKATMTGNGVYHIATNQIHAGKEATASPLNVEFGSDWTGQVNLVSNTQANAMSVQWLNLNHYGNENSTIRLKGVAGSLCPANTAGNSVTFASDLIMENNDKAALELTDGCSADKFIFSGNISNGKNANSSANAGNFIKASDMQQDITFSGDIRQWTGKIELVNGAEYNGNITTLTFTGAATQINNSIIQTRDFTKDGQLKVVKAKVRIDNTSAVTVANGIEHNNTAEGSELHLEVDTAKGTTFNKAVKVTDVTLDDASKAIFTKGLTADAMKLGKSAMLLTNTLSEMTLTAGAGSAVIETSEIPVSSNSIRVTGAATMKAGGSEAGLGVNLVMVGGSTLEINGTEGVSLGGALTLGSGVSLGDNLKYSIESLNHGEKLVLFTNVSSLALPENSNPVAMLAGEGSAPVQADASTVFSELEANVYTITLDNSIVSINMLAVPEPTTATLSLLALAGLAARRRRK